MMSLTATSRAPRVSPVYGNGSGARTGNLVDVDSGVTSVDSEFLRQNIKTSTQAERIEREEAADETSARKKAQAKARSEKAKSRLSRTKDNPIALGNAVLVALASAGLGYGAYQKHLDGKLSWELIGIWSGIVGVAGVADYFASK